MAFAFGQFNEFSDSVTIGDPVIEAVARAIQLGPFHGKFYEAMSAPQTSITQKEFEIYTRTKTARDGATGAASWGADATTGLSINADSIKGLTVGHVLDVAGEVVIISSVNRSANTISVHRRGEGGTKTAAHTAGTTFQVIGFAGNDTDLKNVESVSESTKTWSNYVQTVFETADWTKHAELTRKGLSDANAIVLLTREAEIRVAELLSRMSIRGIKANATGGRYMSAGLLAQLADVENRGAMTYDVGGDLTEAKLKAALKMRFDAGGTCNTIWVSPTNKEYINAFIGSHAGITLSDSKSNHTAGGLYADAYDYEGAILQVRVDADMPGDRIAIVNQSKCKKGWLEGDGLRMVDEPSASSREKRKSLQGSLGFLIEDVGADHLLLTGITGGKAERVYNVKTVTA